MLDKFSTLILDITLYSKEDSQVFTFSIRNYMYKCIYKYICSNNATLDALFGFEKNHF